MGKNILSYIETSILAFLNIYGLFEMQRKKKLSESKENNDDYREYYKEHYKYLDEYKDNHFIGFTKLEDDFRFAGNCLEKATSDFEKEYYNKTK